jgi:myo-inositol 2-dehydrogenase / D-chiro-inositol 1-dehydrogenase
MMLQVAVLGAGRIGKIHAGNVTLNRNAKLVAVADPFGSAAKDLAAQFGCEASLDPLAVIERDDVDAVVVGTPTDTHVPLTLHAVRKGKAVLCEKPIDLDLARVDAAVGEIERLVDPSAQKLRRSIDAGEIGEVRQVIITSRDPELPPRDYIRHSGGIFRDMVIHDFDMARWLLGQEPTEVMAIAGRLVDPSLAEVDDFDTLMVLMRTASGRQCHINCYRDCVYGYDQRFEILGSSGMLLNDNVRPSTVRRWSRTQTEAQEPLLNFFLERYVEAYRTELDLFIKAVEAGEALPTTPHDGRQALRLAECALESALNGRSVKV